MAVLWEGWVQCRGNWHSSELLLSLQSSKKNRRKGGRSWFTLEQLTARYGKDIAEEIVEHKSRDPLLRRFQIKPHPDVPRLMLYLCFDYECEEEEDEDILGYMASAVYKHGSDVDRKSSRKRKHASDSSSESVASSSSSTSSEKNKKKKKKEKKSKKEKKDKRGLKKPTAEQLERKALEEKKREQEKEERRKERELVQREKQQEREIERKRQTVVKDAKRVPPVHV